MKFALTGDWHWGYSARTARIVEKFLKRLAKEDFDILLIAGDIIAYDQSQWEPAMAALRRAFPFKPIIIVMGNHDYWHEHPESVSFLTLETERKRLFREHDIKCLEGDFVDIEGIRIYGFGGWYWSNEPPSNDENFIRRRIEEVSFHDFLLNRATNSMIQILAELPKSNKAVVLTHFEPNGNIMSASEDWLETLIARKCKKEMVIACGHTHYPRHDTVAKGITIENAGGDYDRPAYTVFEL